MTTNTEDNFGVLHIDCSYGVSGDMLNGALLDLGASESALKEKLESLNLEGWCVKATKTAKGTDFDVVLSEDNHDHDMSYLYGKEEKAPIKVKRNLKVVSNLINKSDALTDEDKKLALKIFDIVATAEAKAHGIDKEEVIFHESGAMDSIIDISFLLCLYQNEDD